MNTLYEKIDMIHRPYEAFYTKADSLQTFIAAHWHYFIELLYVDQGTVDVSCDNVEHSLKAGDMLFLHTGVIHAMYHQSHDMVYSVIKLNLSSLHEYTEQLNLAAIIRAARTDSRAPVLIRNDEMTGIPMSEWFHQCIKELAEQKYGYEVCFYATVTNILMTLIRVWCKHGFPTEHIAVSTSEHGSIETIIEYIDEHSDQSLKVETLAQMCGMSYSYFAKNFRNLYGQSCKDYIEFIRINKAKNLLMYTALDLNYISQETGFSDCSHFIRVFKRQEGMTPKQYRNLSQSNK